MHLDTNFVEVVFVAKLPALSSSKFNVFICSDEQDTKNPPQSDENRVKPKEKTLIYCLRCPSKISSSSALRTEAFDVDKLPNDMIQLENSNFLLSFDAETKLLSSIRNKKKKGKDKDVEIEFGAYPTQQFRNGAYLFATDTRRPQTVEVFNDKVKG